MSLGLLLGLLTIVIVRNIIIKIMVIKTYKQNSKKPIFKQIIKNQFRLLNNYQVLGWYYEIKTNLWATQVKVYFTCELKNDLSPSKIRGTIFFSNASNKNIDLQEKIQGAVLGIHAKEWI
ncbi:hypothetical protein SCLARK_001232 [Spiroplasma clarkii]|nr:hypothetical protein SCLARK_001232 [Spiroplasma clarkii]